MVTWQTASGHLAYVWARAAFYHRRHDIGADHYSVNVLHAGASGRRADFLEPLDPTTLETPDGLYNVELFKFNKEKKRWQYVLDTRVSCDRACETITLDPAPGDASRLMSAGRYKVNAWRESNGLKDLSGTPCPGEATTW